MWMKDLVSRGSVEIHVSPETFGKVIWIETTAELLTIQMCERLQSETHAILRARETHVSHEWRYQRWLFIVIIGPKMNWELNYEMIHVITCKLRNKTVDFI